MAVRIFGSNSRRTKVELELPVDENGDWAFDEDDKPIKGKTPVVITLPRFNFLPFDDLKALQDAVSEVEDREVSDDFDQNEKSKQIALASLKPFLTDTQLELVDNFELGVLEQISQEWARQSAMPLGESSASNGSSKNTRRPSNTTSSA